MKNKTTLIILILIIASIGVNLYLADKLPDKMASHWNSSGNIDGYMSKNMAIYLMPGISLLILAFYLLIPKIDPLKENIKKFKNYFDNFIILITLFLLYIQGLTLAWNLNYKFNMNKAILPAVTILIYYSAILIQNSKRNWFIGLRTPWTLSSDKVWDKSNKFAAKLLKFLSLFFIILMFFEFNAWVIIIIILAVIIYAVYYSYLQFKKYN